MSPQTPIHHVRQQDVVERIGLLSKTLVPTPAVRQVIPVRIRSPTNDDYVCVGKDFIQLFEIDAEARTTLVATKSDFDAEIRSANFIGYFDTYKNEFKDTSNGPEKSIDPLDPLMGPQMLTFTLVGIAKLFFLTAAESDDGEITFKVSCVPTHNFGRPPRMYGNALAVDPRSRALAVATGENQVEICYANQAKRLSTGQQKWETGFIPVSNSRIIKLQGSILLMDFLFPSQLDPDRVVLLMIVLHDERVRPAWVEWSSSDEVESADLKLGQRLLPRGELPNLLIPLKGNAAFAIATQRGLLICQNILTTSIMTYRQIVNRAATPTNYPAASYRPLWACWTRPRRGSDYDQEEDYIYLVSEDGLVYYLVFDQDAPAEGLLINHVGSLNCHVSTACAPFGKSDRDDILIAHGEFSEGCIWKAECRQPPSNEEEPNGGLHGSVVAILPNWSGNSDLVAKPSSRKRPLPNSRDILLAPCGRQPHGRIAELRWGLAASIGHALVDDSGYFPYGNICQAWVLPLKQHDTFLLLLSTPGQSHVVSIPQNLDEKSSIQTLDSVGLDLNHPTLAAAMIDDNCIFQVTEFAMVLCRQAHNGSSFKAWPQGIKAVAAAIEKNQAIAVVALREAGQSRIELQCADVDGAVKHLGLPVRMNAEVISLAMHCTQHNVLFVLAGTSDGALHLSRVHTKNGLEVYLELKIPENPYNREALNACGDILILRDDGWDSPRGPVNLIVLCGLRGGSVYAFELRVSSDASFQVGSQRHINLGFTTVKLRPGKTTASSFAACGDGFFSITSSGPKLDALKIADVYLAEVGSSDGAFRQESVTAFSLIPNIGTSNLSDALLVFSNENCFVTSVSEEEDLVPKNINVRGSPDLLIHSKPLNCLVSVSSRVEFRSPTTRTVQEVIEFIADDWRLSHGLEIGHKVFAMTEWSYQKPSDAQKHHFIAVAAGRPEQYDEMSANPRPSRTGWIYLIGCRPSAGLLSINCVKSFPFPVTAIATYSDTAIVACSGIRVYFLEYDPVALKFTETCRFIMNSPAKHITTSAPHVHITTQRDSTLTLQLVEDPANNKRRFHNVARGDGARLSTSHLTVAITHANTTTSSFNLTSTLTGDLVGLRIPDPNHPPTIATHHTLFTAKLPRSVMRIIEAKVRPPWKPTNAVGVLKDDLVGITTDGTIYGFAVLDARMAHRLRWVQRLCQRNPDICPFGFIGPEPMMTNGTSREMPVSLPPLGFEHFPSSSSSPADAQQVRRTTRHRPADMHVNGDFLQRLLERGGAELLDRILELEAAKDTDAVSDWVRENLEAHRAEVDVLIAEITAVLDRWW